MFRCRRSCTQAISTPQSSPESQQLHRCRYGHLTWEWAAGLRGYTHPLLFAAPFQLLAWLRLDTPASLPASAQVLQGVMAAAADVFVFRLARLLFGLQAARCRGPAWGWLPSATLCSLSTQRCRSLGTGIVKVRPCQLTAPATSQCSLLTPSPMQLARGWSLTIAVHLLLP